MSKYLEVNEDFVKSLMKQAAWDKLNVVVEQEAPSEEPVEEDATIEEHTCPLCESTLEEELSDEALLEHLEKISNLLSEDSVEEDVEEDVDEDESLEEDEDVEIELSTREAQLLQKIKELKEKKWSGQKKGDDSKTKKKGKDFEGNGNGDDDDDDNGDPKAFGGKKGDKSKTKKGKDFEKKA